MLSFGRAAFSRFAPEPTTALDGGLIANLPFSAGTLVLVDATDLQRLILGIHKDCPHPAELETTPDIRQPDPYRTGLPGRPSIHHLIEAEFLRRAEARECLGTLAAEARALRDWARRTHPAAPTPMHRSIGNMIRHAYNTHVRGTK